VRARTLFPRRVGLPADPEAPDRAAATGRSPASLPPLRAPPPRRCSDGTRLHFLRARDADARLCSLGASLAAARPVLGVLATALTGRRSYEALGYRSLGDYGRERLGVGARVIREWARVWRRLGSLSRLRSAVLAGEVSWTAARLVVGLATSETEDACLEAIRGRTVRAIEAIVAAFRSARGPGGGSDADADDDGNRIGVRLRCTRREARMWSQAVELARRSAGEELALWECAERIAAEAASAWGASPPSEGSGEPEAQALAEISGREHGLRKRAFPRLGWRALRRALPAEIASLADGAPELSAREVDRRLRAVIAFLQTVDFEMGCILREMQARGLFRELGFAGLERYAVERLDLSVATARRLVALARTEQRAPEVARAYRQGRLHAFQARVLARVAGPASARAWVERARAVSLRRLERDADAVPVDFIAFRAPPEVAELFLAMRARAGSLERLLAHAIATWLQQAAPFEDYADFERDGWRCTVPGCTARKNLQSHHIRFRSAGGPDEPWNRTTLCAHHHQRGVHGSFGGTVRIRGTAPDGLVFELGGRRYLSGDVLFSKAAMVCSVTPMSPAARG
jgi:hypothetical protein